MNENIERKTPTLDQRLALRERPDAGHVMRQRWAELLFLHWEVPAEAVQQRLPDGLFVDLHDGRAFLGFVPFLMRAIRPRGLPAVPYLSNFLECNVRTYVHDARGTPGVWFFSLDTDRWVAFQVARRVFHLPYFWARMQASVTERVTFDVQRRGTEESVRYDYGRPESTAVAEPGSLEFFLLERYLLFAFNASSGSLRTGRVHHAPYRYGSTDLKAWSTQPAVWNGFDPLHGDPVHSCVAETVDVEVFRLETA